MEHPMESLIKECKRLQENCLWNATAHFTAAEIAGWGHLLGGSLPIIFGAIGGWKFLINSNVATSEQIFFAGLATLAAGIIGSLMSFWNLTRTRHDHFCAGTKFKTLENEFRRAHEIHALAEDHETFKSRALALCKRYDETCETVTLTNSFVFWLAGKKIKKGIFTTEADKKVS